MKKYFLPYIQKFKLITKLILPDIEKFNLI
jgi:hypothetical protein